MAYENLIIALAVIIIPIIVVSAVIVVIVVWILKRLKKDKNNLEILKNRLAKGEITQNEYDELRKKLEK